MAKGDKSTTPQQEERSIAISVASTPDNPMGGNVLAAWKVIYNIFGGQAKWAIDQNGVQVSDFSVKAPYDPQQIAEDVSHRNRRLDLISCYPIIAGTGNPEPYTDAKQITQDTVQFWRESVDPGSSRSPKYLRDAVAAWKSDNNMAKRRGPRKKTFRLDAEGIQNITAESLVGVEESSIEELKELLETVIAQRQSAPENTGSEAETANA